MAGDDQPGLCIDNVAQASSLCPEKTGKMPVLHLCMILDGPVGSFRGDWPS